MSSKDEHNQGLKPGQESVESNQSASDAWGRLRGALKRVYAELGGGEAYLRNERESFNSAAEKREKLIG